MSLRPWAIVALGLFGCDAPDKPQPLQAAPTNAVTAQPAQPSYAMTNAQPKLPTIKIWLGSQEVDAEIASTSAQIATGMMFRKQMGENEGMLFVFLRPHRTSFYMRNTYIPLSCAYINGEGTIEELHDMKPLDETPILAGSENIQYVLEMPQGWFEKHKISAGMVVRTERGSLRDTFFTRRK